MYLELLSGYVMDMTQNEQPKTPFCDFFDFEMIGVTPAPLGNGKQKIFIGDVGHSDLLAKRYFLPVIGDVE